MEQTNNKLIAVSKFIIGDTHFRSRPVVRTVQGRDHKFIKIDRKIVKLDELEKVGEFITVDSILGWYRWNVER